MSSGKTKTLLAAGVAAGFSIGLILYFIERYIRRKEEQAVIDDLNLLKRVVSELREEITNLRNVRKSVRRSFACSESDFASITDTDDEFYDLTSDDDELNFRINNLEVKKQEECIDHPIFNQIDEQLQDTEDPNKAISLMLENLQQFNSNADFLWRLAKAYYLKTNECGSGDNEERKRFIELGLKYAEKAIEVDKTNADAHKWFAILTGVHADYLPTKEKIKNGFLFQQHVKEAIKQKPTDYSLYHLLARFKCEVAGLSWMERKVAAAIYGEPPSATYEDALCDCLKAEELNQKPWAENRLLAAKCAFGSADYAQGFSWLEKTKSVLSTDSPSEYKLRQEVEQLAKKYSKYSK